MLNFFLIILGIAIWVGCGIIAYGLIFAYFQREFPLRTSKYDVEQDRRLACGVALMGVIGLIVSLLFCSKHGIMFKKRTDT